MAVTELIQSRLQVAGDNKSVRSKTTFKYVADGYADEPSVIAAVKAACGTTYGTQRFVSCEITERINAQAWFAKADFIDVPAIKVQYDSTGGTQHVTQDIALQASYGNTENIQGAIGFDGENVAGLDKVVPIFNWTETRYFTTAQLNVPGWYAAEGCVNSDTWGAANEFTPGEVLFYGFTGQELEDGLWEIQFKFGFQPNVSGLTVGGISGITKNGWDYLDVYYKKISGTKTIIPKPDAIYIHKVYNYVSFIANLGFAGAI